MFPVIVILLNGLYGWGQRRYWCYWCYRCGRGAEESLLARGIRWCQMRGAVVGWFGDMVWGREAIVRNKLGVLRRMGAACRIDARSANGPIHGFREAGAFDGGFMRIHCPLVFAIVLNHVVKGEPQAPERQLE